MKRILIRETPEHNGETVRLAGWVKTRRDHGKLVFIDLRDRSGVMQMIVVPDHARAYEFARSLSVESSVEVEGLVKSRPVTARGENSSVDGFEIEVQELRVLSLAHSPLSIDPSVETLELRLKTLLDHRQLSLRNKKVNAVFRVYANVLQAYGEAMRQEGFMEIKSPKILNAATEGGANFFKIQYFDRSAYLAQSPQFYKQAAVGAFERVFEIGSVFRAEPHFTTRHVNEYTGLDAEMGFIDSFADVMDALEKTMAYMFASIQSRCAQELSEYGVELSEVREIPRIKLMEALRILEERYGKKMEDGAVDIDPEGERLIGAYAKETYGSDLLFLTHYPTALRPFYTMPSQDAQFTESFDLLFRGLEIASGGQRIHDYERLIENIASRGLNPEDFEHYLENFRLGMPPHGGWGLGSERIVQQMLGLKSIKEAILFPRDVKRLVP